MKNKLHMIFGTILLSLPTVAFADVPATVVIKSESAKSSLSNPVLQKKSIVTKEPVITNEAEYAEFVQKNERASKASSVKSVVSRSASSKSSQKSIQ